MASSAADTLYWEYRGVTLPKPVTKEVLDDLLDYKIRDDDIVVVSYPRTGTHWLAGIIGSILRAAGKTEESTDDLTAGVLEMKLKGDDQPSYLTMAHKPSPRLLLTHLPVGLAPRDISKPRGKVKVLVTMRNPKDTAVSEFYFMNKIAQLVGAKDSFHWERFLTDFLDGKVMYGNFFDHLLGWWQMRDDPHFLFLKYEDMKRDLTGTVKNVSRFLDISLDEATLTSIAESSTFDNMKRDFFDSSQVHERKLMARKGIVGDWKNTFKPEESSTFDAWCEKRLAGTGITFDFE